MFAISNRVNGQTPSWRSIQEGDPLLDGEIRVDDIPDRPVWDDSLNGLRSMTEAEWDARHQTRNETAAAKRAAMSTALDAARRGGMNARQRDEALTILIEHYLGSSET